jgi:hypothetical protein
VFYIKETGEIFLDYEWVVFPGTRTRVVVVVETGNFCWCWLDLDVDSKYVDRILFYKRKSE